MLARHGAARWGRENLGEVRFPNPSPSPSRHGKGIPHLGPRCFSQSTNLTSTSTSDLLAVHRQSSPLSIHSQSLPHIVPAPSTPPPGIQHLPARLAHGLQHPSPANPDPAQPAPSILASHSCPPTHNTTGKDRGHLLSAPGSYST